MRCPYLAIRMAFRFQPASAGVVLSRPDVRLCPPAHVDFPARLSHGQERVVADVGLRFRVQGDELCASVVVPVHAIAHVEANYPGFRVFRLRADAGPEVQPVFPEPELAGTREVAAGFGEHDALGGAETEA